MYYKIDLKQIKKMIGNSLSTFDISKELTPKTFTLKDIDKVSLQDIKSYDRNESNPSFVNASILAKELYLNSNKQDDTIKLVGSDGKFTFKDWQSLGQYLGLLLLNKNEAVVESDIPILDYGTEINANEVREYVTDSYPINWEIPINLKADSWDNVEYAIKELKNTYRDHADAKDAIKKIPKHLLSNKDFLDKFLELKDYAHLYGYLDRDSKIDPELYLQVICENPDAFFAQFSNEVGDHLSTVGQLIERTCKAKEILKHPTSEFHNLNVLDSIKDELSDLEKESIAIVKYLINNLFSESSKVIGLLGKMNKKGSKIDFDTVSELVSYVPINVQMNENVIKAVKLCHANSGRDFYRKSVISVIPPEYFDSSDKAKIFLKELMFTDDENARSLFPDYICKIFENDPKTICELVDTAYEAKGINFAENVLSKLKEKATSSVLLDREFFKRLVKVDSYTFKNFAYDKTVKSTYKDFITKDKEMMDYICKNGAPKTLCTMPGEFLKQINDESLKEKLIREDYHLLDLDSPVAEWRKDINLLASAGRNISNLCIKKTELSEIIKNSKDAQIIVEVDPDMYVNLPVVYKKDPDVSLVAIQNSWRNIREIDCSLLLDKKFSLEAIKTNGEFIKDIPKSFFNDENYMLEIFKAMDIGLIGRAIIKEFPQNVSKCIEAFGVTENFESFGKSYFANQRLSNSLNINESPKSKKIKI